MLAVAQDLQRGQRTFAETRLPGQLNTAQDIIKSIDAGHAAHPVSSSTSWRSGPWAVSKRTGWPGCGWSRARARRASSSSGLRSSRGSGRRRSSPSCWRGIRCSAPRRRRARTTVRSNLRPRMRRAGCARLDPLPISNSKYPTPRKREAAHSCRGAGVPLRGDGVLKDDSLCVPVKRTVSNRCFLIPFITSVQILVSHAAHLH